MKKIIWIIPLVLLAILLASGCTSASQPAAPVVPVTPDLTGTWTGTMQGYKETKGFEDFSRDSITMVVTEQKGRIFSGNFRFVINGTTHDVAMAGVIGNDGRTISLVENSNGYTFGEITGNNEIQLTHLDDDEPSFSVALDTLKKV